MLKNLRDYGKMEKLAHMELFFERVMIAGKSDRK
jgi:hypothetical protein